MKTSVICTGYGIKGTKEAGTATKVIRRDVVDTGIGIGTNAHHRRLRLTSIQVLENPAKVKYRHKGIIDKALHSPEEP
jgi:hypothetical protein